ncbi:MAG: hypothetical protein DRR42_03490 [Gammaproteobacteria bacterium]|nr:MAG: hypothetical protein DRQ98_08120 [Gammaproteobacteria bacterium]RLA53891.1 MAG: hypothetical protein DRR42_03490 [Gammaproteobacteria bacterium]
MTYIIIFAVIIVWLNLAILADKSINELYDMPLETLVLPLRLITLLLSPILLIVYERHLFYSKADRQI